MLALLYGTGREYSPTPTKNCVVVCHEFDEHHDDAERNDDGDS
jgi:hypothetical protein